jgi:hypothetical protein
VFCALTASGVVEPDARTFSNLINATLVVALLSFVPEMFWKRYAGSPSVG